MIMDFINSADLGGFLPLLCENLGLGKDLSDLSKGMVVLAGIKAYTPVKFPTKNSVLFCANTRDTPISH